MTSCQNDEWVRKRNFLIKDAYISHYMYIDGTIFSVYNGRKNYMGFAVIAK